MSYHTPGHVAPLHERLQGIELSLANGSTNLQPFGAQLDRDQQMITVRTHRGPATFWLRDLATIVRATAQRAGVRSADHTPVKAPVRDPVDDLATLLQQLQEAGRITPLEDGRVCMRTPHGTATFLPSPDAIKELSKDARRNWSPVAFNLYGRTFEPSVWTVAERLGCTTEDLEQRVKAVKRAPGRGYGNFTTPEAAAQSIADLEHNVREALRMGHTAFAATLRGVLAKVKKQHAPKAYIHTGDGE